MAGFEIICDDAEKSISISRPPVLAKVHAVKTKKSVFRIVTKETGLNVDDGYIKTGRRLYIVVSGECFFNFVDYHKNAYTSGGGLHCGGETFEVGPYIAHILCLKPHTEVLCITTEASEKSFVHKEHLQNPYYHQNKYFPLNQEFQKLLAS